MSTSKGTPSPPESSIHLDPAQPLSPSLPEPSVLLRSLIWPCLSRGGRFFTPSQKMFQFFQSQDFPAVLLDSDWCLCTHSKGARVLSVGHPDLLFLEDPSSAEAFLAASHFLGPIVGVLTLKVLIHSDTESSEALSPMEGLDLCLTWELFSQTLEKETFRDPVAVAAGDAIRGSGGGGGGPIPSSVRDWRRPALFLDRDGVIIEDQVYIKSFDQVRLLPDAPPLLERAKGLGYFIGIVTNQSGIGRGYYSFREYYRISDYILKILASHHVFVDVVSASAFHQLAVDDEGRELPHFRKPRPGMILDQARRYHLHLSDSVLVGDKASDLIAGVMAGLREVYLIERKGVKETESEEWMKWVRWWEKWKPSILNQGVDVLTEAHFITHLSQVHLPPLAASHSESSCP